MSDLVKQENTAISIFNPDVMKQLVTFSEMMASSSITVPDHLRGKPSDCMAIAMQAAQWGMNPYAVAQKTHLVNGKLGYEAQLVSAVIGSSKAIKGRFKYEFVGDWSKFDPKNPSSEDGLGVRCGAIIAGESEITWGHVIWLKHITTRNSPLWKTNPQQQIQYLATKYWSRVYTPDVILGVYDKDDLEEPVQAVEKDITPPRKAKDLNDMFNGEQVKEEPQQDSAEILEAEILEDEANHCSNDLQHFEMTKFDEIKGLIKSANDRQGYKEAVQVYTDSLTREQITMEEATELKVMLNQLYQSLL
ncbi:TPA: RecT family recombinase [Vibrio cholerae]